MGSLETGLSFKKDSSIESFRTLSSSRIERQSSRGRSLISRLLLPKKLGYLQWISIIVIFFVFLGLFHLFLPASLSVMERPRISGKNGQLFSWHSIHLKDIVGDLEFGERLRLQPKWLFTRFQKEAREVFADLAFDSYQILMTTVAAALQELGYSVEVFSAEDGPAVTVWRYLGVPTTIIHTEECQSVGVDWLNYDGILANSLEAKGAEPFKSLPLIWTIHEKTLATRFSHYKSSGRTEILSGWKKSFNRATAVVFPNYALPIMYSRLDAGNYFMVPGSPAEACEFGLFLNPNEENLHAKMDIKLDDLVIAIVGSHFLYKGLWLEHSLILQALKPLLAEFPSDDNSNSLLKIFIVTEDGTTHYTAAVEAISAGLNYPKDIVKHVVGDASADIILKKATIVIYGSLLEEQSFPDILTKALCYRKLILAPRLSMIEKFVDDRVNGFLFPKENIQALTEIVSQVVSGGKLTPLAQNVASKGKEIAKNLMVSDAVVGYASLLESMLRLPSEVAPPKASSEIPLKNKKEWQWDIFKTIYGAVYKNRTLSSSIYLEKIEHQNQSQAKSTMEEDESFMYRIWEEEKETQMVHSRKRIEDEELKDRSISTRATWEDVYRNAKRADRAKNDLHERDDGELERTGQPLCIYEPYFGEGTWPFLHHTSLYRGIGLSTRGRRRGRDDIDASSRLPLLSNPYYRDVLGEMGAFFSIAHRIDRVHRNAWIGFQSWRVTARKESLSKTAEYVLLNATQTRKNGDTLYFWTRMDSDPRNPRKLDFWSFCDAINAGNCRSAFSSTLKRMYGITHSGETLPPMPSDGDTWSVMHTWALPTRSFLEFVMFARMFVDAMDSQMYDDHHKSELCYLSPAKQDNHCYSRVLELLINVWAYHSARKMVYINPETGAMKEHHMLKGRKGQMWVKWFLFSTLKSMDEDLAEEADSEPSKRRWLWPSTGEVFWQGMYEKERILRLKDKEKRRQKSKDKLQRMRRRTHQKVLGKFVKPDIEEETENGNSTLSLERR
ncbi:hypothetical protein V2J09_024318 [Rumex salicifolius]